MRATLILFSASIAQSIGKINWIRASGRYVIIDPNNKDLLLYLDEKQYIKLVDVSLSNDVHLTVLADPEDTESSVQERNNLGKNVPNGTPQLDDWISKRSRVLSYIQGWEIKESMIKFERNFEKFIPLYYRDIMSWFGFPFSTYGAKELEKFNYKMVRVFRFRGINQVIITLKIYSIVILQYIAGTKLTSTQELGQRLRLVHGLPAALPVYFRNFIRSNDLNRIRVLITLLHSYKGMVGKYKAPDLSSITAPRYERPPLISHLSVDGSPFWDNSELNQDWTEVDNNVPKFWKSFNPSNIKPELMAWINHMPLPLTAGPNHSISFLGSLWDALSIHYGKSANLQRYHNAISAWEIANNGPYNKAAAVYNFMVTHAEKFKEEIEQGKISWKTFYETSIHGTLFAGDLFKFPEGVSNSNTKEKNFSVIITWDWVKDVIIPNLRVGKLALKFEAAGKVRVFAIGDFWSQWMLKPT
jgi:hypothetical protein